jgi:hypothetical protein
MYLPARRSRPQADIAAKILERDSPTHVTLAYRHPILQTLSARTNGARYF